MFILYFDACKKINAPSNSAKRMTTLKKRCKNNIKMALFKKKTNSTLKDNKDEKSNN